MVIAHRGFSGSAPENTLAAFRRAIEAGSDMFELDVHLSKDGHVVVIHDEKLERTTNGEGRIADFTLDELKSFDAGTKFSTAFAGERIPTLGEALRLAQDRIPINIEIKSGYLGPFTLRDLADRTLAEVRKAGMLNRVIFSSFYPASLERIVDKAPRARIALLYHQPWQTLGDVTKGKTYRVLNLRNTYLTKEKIERIHGEGMEVNVYTVNDEEEMEKLIRWRVDGIVTNHPDRLIAVLQKLEKLKP